MLSTLMMFATIVNPFFIFISVMMVSMCWRPHHVTVTGHKKSCAVVPVIGAVIRCMVVYMRSWPISDSNCTA